MPQTTDRPAQRPELAMVVRDRRGMRRMLGALSQAASSGAKQPRPSAIASLLLVAETVTRACAEDLFSICRTTQP
jgi:hypothetical protein